MLGSASTGGWRRASPGGNPIQPSSRSSRSTAIHASPSPGPSEDAAAAAAKASSSSASAPEDRSLEPFKRLVEARRFHCTMCGKCCTGEGEIWVSHDEARRIAAHLNLSLQRFLDTRTKSYSRYRGWRMLKTKDGSTDCIFLGADNKCSVHTVRPSQCSTYPWWPELTLDKEWEWEKQNICEGFDHPEAGPLDVADAARQLREANKMTQLRLLASTARVKGEVADWAESVLIWDEGQQTTRAEGSGGGSMGGRGKVRE